MKILVAIMSCWVCELNGDNQSLRDTWLKDLSAYPNVDYKFFLGFPSCSSASSDIIVLDVPDDYSSLILKSQTIHSWGHSHGYDFVFKVDTDTYVDVPQLMTSGFEKYDYSGYLHTLPKAYSHTPHGLLGGGEGYWTSRRACEIISKAAPSPIGEDLWTANVLGEAGISMVGLSGYGQGITLHGGVVTNAPRGFYNHKWMYATYAKRNL